jgi:hypothetical protein
MSYANVNAIRDMLLCYDGLAGGRRVALRRFAKEDLGAFIPDGVLLIDARRPK